MGDWKKEPWICEDCQAVGIDWGIPDKCPVCGSVNTRPQTEDD